MLVPLLFLIYVNYLYRASAYINPIMFVDDTNSFCSSKDTKTLFETMNFELRKISEWLKTSKISINMDNTNFIFFQLHRANKNLPVKLLLLPLGGQESKKVSSAKFLGVQINENITWKLQITLTQNKRSKNLSVLVNAKLCQILNHYENYITLFIHTYFNYAHIGWVSTNKIKLKNLCNQQKQALRIIYHKDKLDSVTYLFN